jgi:hypothetical protein
VLHLSHLTCTALLHELFTAALMNQIFNDFWNLMFKPLNTNLNPICHLPALLAAHPILHVSKIRVNIWKDIEQHQSCEDTIGCYCRVLRFLTQLVAGNRSVITLVCECLQWLPRGKRCFLSVSRHPLHSKLFSYSALLTSVENMLKCGTGKIWFPLILIISAILDCV